MRFHKASKSKVSKAQNKALQQSVFSSTTGGMQIPSLPELLKMLRDKTAKRGMKSKLAADLHVPLANVSLWLSGEREPGGAVTLKLFQWVKHQGR
jgi:hypothetical protein